MALAVSTTACILGNWSTNREGKIPAQGEKVTASQSSPDYGAGLLAKIA